MKNTPRPPIAWRAFLPARTGIDARERWRIVIGALLGILLTAAVSRLVGGAAHPALPWLLAPLGASAVLVFAVPASPMAQPWPVVGGNTLSALAGIAGVHGAHLLAWPELAAALSVATAIMLMLALRCLHPPGGATALTMVLAGIADPLYAFYPVLLNSLLLVLAGVLYNQLTHRAYPHMQRARPGRANADLDAVLAGYNQLLDISRDDLQTLVAQTRERAWARGLGELRCADIMSRELVTVEFGTSLQAAWALLRERKVKALPVVDRNGRIAGIVTLADFMRIADLDIHEGFAGKLKAMLRSTAGMYSSKPEVVGQIMTRQVRVASLDRSLAELLPLFGGSGHHHIPVIAADGRLAGIITQSDLVAALGRLADPSR